MQQVGVGEVKLPRRAHVVRHLVGGEVAEAGLQLAERRPQLRRDAIALQAAGALVREIAAAEERGHALVVEGRFLQRTQQRRRARRRARIGRGEHREGKTLRDHFRVARAIDIDAAHQKAQAARMLDEEAAQVARGLGAAAAGDVGRAPRLRLDEARRGRRRDCLAHQRAQVHAHRHRSAGRRRDRRRCPRLRERLVVVEAGGDVVGLNVGALALEASALGAGADHAAVDQRRSGFAQRAVDFAGGAGPELPRLQHGRLRVARELQRRQKERVVELLLGQRRVLAGAERRDPAADFVDAQVADFVDRLRLAARRRAGDVVRKVRIGDVDAEARAAQQHRPGRLAHLEHRVLAAQREGGLLAHGRGQRPFDAQRAEPFGQRPGRGRPHTTARADVRGARPGDAGRGEQQCDDGAHFSNPACAE